MKREKGAMKRRRERRRGAHWDRGVCLAADSMETSGPQRGGCASQERTQWFVKHGGTQR